MEPDISAAVRKTDDWLPVQAFKLLLITVALTTLLCAGPKSITVSSAPTEPIKNTGPVIGSNDQSIWGNKVNTQPGFLLYSDLEAEDLYSCEYLPEDPYTCAIPV